MSDGGGRSGGRRTRQPGDGRRGGKGTRFGRKGRREPAHRQGGRDDRPFREQPRTPARSAPAHRCRLALRSPCPGCGGQEPEALEPPDPERAVPQASGGGPWGTSHFQLGTGEQWQDDHERDLEWGPGPHWNRGIRPEHLGMAAMMDIIKVILSVWGRLFFSIFIFYA